jgi:hypothetical protein
MSVFAITRGQFSMIDAMLHILAAGAPARISIWTWALAEYEVDLLARMMQDDRINEGRLLIDGQAKNRNNDLIECWRENFGNDSVRFLRNHAKMVTVESSAGRFAMRGSMNLNCNLRFENIDIDEGGLAFELIRRLEDELFAQPCATTPRRQAEVSKIGDRYDQGALAFGGAGAPAAFRDVKPFST